MFFKHFVKRFIIFILFPSLAYFVIFYIYTYPSLHHFSTHLFADTVDGLVHYWNLWWVNKAITQLHSSIWYTSYLYYPYGILLFGHSLNVYNGFFSIPFQPFLSLVQTYNTIVVASFIFSGCTMCVLSFYVTKNYRASLVAGFMYAFCNYRFAHTEGHMELISTQWVPLFIYFWLRLLSYPTGVNAFFSALVLFLNLISTPYYFIYSSITAGLLLFLKLRKLNFMRYLRSTLLTYLLFGAVFLLLSGFYLFPLLFQVQNELKLAYSPEAYSTDLLAPFIFGGHSRFANSTYNYWSRLSGNIHESSVYVGIAPSIILLYVFLKRKQFGANFPKNWYIVAGVFFILSLGPVLHIGGKEVWSFLMPYTLFEFFWTFIRIGTPVRMIVITQVAVSLISAQGISYLLKGTWQKKVLVAIFLIVLFIEYWPRQLTLSDLAIPPYVQFIKNIPNQDAIIDTYAYPSLRMYYQTIHEKPIQFGYLSRIPKSTIKLSIPLESLIDSFDSTHLYEEYHFHYLVSPVPFPNRKQCPQLLYADDLVWIYDLRFLVNDCNTISLKS